jgi:hypothetical protein
MPLQIPTLDDRKYQDLLDEALARIPIHNPEWTNFNKSDPGVTLLELFAFLTENLLYRSNQIPERNRKKFLSLLGVPLQAASSARGIVTFANDRGALRTVTLNDGLEVRAGQVPFRTEAGLDVLPIEAQVFYKREMTSAPDELREYYKQLYASYQGRPPADLTELRLYETVPLITRPNAGVDLGQTIDSSVWIALLVRAGDKPVTDDLKKDVRAAIGGKTLNLGLVPYFDAPQRGLAPTATASDNVLRYQIPKIPPSGGLPETREPEYQTLTTSEVPIEPAIVQITLPAITPPDGKELQLWNNLDPLESGVGNFPPDLEDTTLNERLLTWLRIRAPSLAQFKVMWTGINAAFVTQRARVANERLPDGTGEPDQAVALARTPVIPNTMQLSVNVNGQDETWTEIDDLLSAGPEVPTPDLREPPGAPPIQNDRRNVYTVDVEAGVIRFGDGMRGRRPPRGAILRASYDYGVGREGNIGPGSIDTGPALPAGLKVTNPIRTWRGAEAETVSDGEKQIARYLQHRDRLVNATDFETITLRTPGVDIGRVEVLPAFNPDLPQREPGDAPGAVTLLLIPKYDPAHPDTPEPDSIFLNTVCQFLDPRRLVTTEVFLRGPKYKSIYISLGFKPVAGVSVALVREAVKQAIFKFLSPLPPAAGASLDAQTAAAAPQYAASQKGWPLLKPVVDRELMAVASRVPGVMLVTNVLLAVLVEGTSTATTEPIPMSGLELPRIAGISVSVGDPISIEQLSGQSAAIPIGPGDGPTPGSFTPVPVVPQECT